MIARPPSAPKRPPVRTALGARDWIPLALLLGAFALAAAGTLPGSAPVAGREAAARRLPLSVPWHFCLLPFLR